MSLRAGLVSSPFEEWEAICPEIVMWNAGNCRVGRRKMNPQRYRNDLYNPESRINRLLTAIYVVHTFGGRGSPSL
jgi:hypothetical protein